MTVPVLIVSHGDLARELLASARAISGRDASTEKAPIDALCVDWRAGRAQASRLIETRIRQLDQEHGSGVLILTEMFGDTPCNSALRAAGVTRAAVVTGVNLPMVLSLCCGAPDLDLPDLADWIWSNGRKSIQLAATGLARPAE
ncbi:MAG: PTS fructose transporter subunit IIA [Holophagales bacterium]|nr:PTS fructose transporter subunit IIA [Holophagales bacterium]MXX60819.1 PTS fructose transporter subunit IIA [Holophagales bacterium]MYA08117.1 PTS fructose transporter subunit IIA [Holophagales bacterium]MYC10240.1 PTS fructose transporter subunit IIA [Holophagales bacterium]MYD22481.1 PTS fructose transporter subunit IIA [Holophagales bacterium]